MTRMAAVPVVITILASCTGTDESVPAAPPTPSVRDSAGITIVENASARWDSTTAWRVSGQPMLDIGAGIEGDPNHHFANLVSVRRLPDDIILAADAGTYLLNFFDMDGRLVSRAGGEGSGPGELGRGMLARVLRCDADSLFVFGAGRINVYSAGGQYARTFMLSPANDRLPTPQLCAGNRIVTTVSPGPFRTEPGVFRDSSLLALYSTDGQLFDTVPPIPRQDRSYSRSTAHEGVGYMPLPFGRTLALAAHGNVTVSGIGDDLDLEYRDSTGTLVRIVRAPAASIALTDADIDRYRDFVFDGFRGNAGEFESIDNLLDGPDLPATWPEFAELLFDQTGNLWVRRYDWFDAIAFFNWAVVGRGGLMTRVMPDAPRTWTVFDPEGVLLGEVTTPAGFVVHEIGDEWLIGIRRDDLDVDHILMYGLTKSVGK